MDWSTIPPIGVVILFVAAGFVWGLVVSYTAYAAAVGWKEGSK